jgi:hypothetical protein
MIRVMLVICVAAFMAIAMIGCSDGGTTAVPTVTKTIGVTGGTVTAANNAVEITIPANALPADVAVSITPVSAAAFAESLASTDEILSVVTFGPAGTNFTTPAEITFNLSPAMTAGEEIPFMLYDDNTKTWSPEGVATVAADGLTATAQVSHFSTYATLKNSMTVNMYASDVRNDSFNFSTRTTIFSKNEPNPDVKFSNPPATLSFISGQIFEITTAGTNKDALAKYRSLTSVPSAATFASGSITPDLTKLYIVKVPNRRTIADTNDVSYYKYMLFNMNTTKNPPICTIRREEITGPPTAVADSLNGRWWETSFMGIDLTKYSNGSYGGTEVDWQGMRVISATLNGHVLSGTWTAINAYSFANNSTTGAFTMTFNNDWTSATIVYNEGGTLQQYTASKTQPK